MLLAEQLSTTQLPLPVVLVVGDDSSYFSSEVWQGVLDAARSEHLEHGGSEHVTALRSEDEKQLEARNKVEITFEDLIPILEAPYGEVHRKLRDNGWGWTKRPLTRRPLPLQLSHPRDPDPRSLKDRLWRILDLFDVWAIVASASAGDVKPLREALEGIDIPLLVTTDSTTVPASGQRPNELRLMPSNQAQATAMLFTAIRENGSGIRSLDEKAALRALPPIACSRETTPQAHEYVSDLYKQLQREARRLGIKIDDFKKTADNLGPVIVIGYADHAESIIRSRAGGRLTILSDGCATREVQEAVESHRRDPGYWYVARPEVELRDLGRTLFSVVAESGRKLLTWDKRSASEKDLPKTSLRDVIKDRLGRADEKSFNFAGIENVAPAYRVLRVLEGDVDPGAAAPTEDSGAPSKSGDKNHLSLVRKR